MHVPYKVLKIWTPQKIAVIILKFEQGGFTIMVEECVQKMQKEWQTVQTLIRLLLQEQSDLLHCLP